MIDAKAEKQNGDRTATIQMSQTSMRVRIRGRGHDIDKEGSLAADIVRGNRTLHVVTIIVKFVYVELGNSHYDIQRIILACIPSGKLQDRYNPSQKDTIWLMGRDSPQRGEDFRIRLSFQKLKDKAGWRIHEIPLLEN